MSSRIKRAAMAATALAAVSGVTAATNEASAKPIAREWHLTIPSISTPLKVRGSSCTADEFNTMAHTTWGTGLVCEAYFTSTGATARHWTFLKYDVVNGDACSTTGYFYPHLSLSGRSYRPDICSAATVSPRVPYPPVIV